MTKVLITDEKTQAITIKELSYDLPLYDIGYGVSYKEEQTNGVIKFIEANIIGIKMDITLTGKSELISAVMYELDNGEDIFEEQVEFYWENDITEEEHQGSINE